MYGSGAEIGDPYFTSTAATTTGSASFAGAFNTTAAGSATLDTAATYSWGIEYPGSVAATGAGSGSAVKWTAQSLVYPIAWP